MNVDALTSWLDAHPSFVAEAPDLVAALQKLAREIEEADTKDIPGLMHQYRMFRRELTGLEADDGEDDLTARLSAPVRDPKRSKP